MHSKMWLSIFYNSQILKRMLLILLALLLLIYCINPARFASYYSYIREDGVEHELESSPHALLVAKNSSKPLCPILSSKGSNKSLLHPPIDLNKCDVSNLGTKLNIKQGGSWKPVRCVSRFDVAIIVPYRNRDSQLQVFLAYMHPFLQKQMLNYRIFIIEQGKNGAFNRAKLFNIGYIEAMKIFPYHCFIFHDVDLIPQKLSNIYACTQQPRHMSSSVNTFRYNLPYKELFGGAVAILQKQFELVNGFSNIFFGWGGEDDDFQRRINNKGLTISRFSPYIARYFMLPHAKESPNVNRFLNLKLGEERFDKDGINTLAYTVFNITYEPLYTWILVNI